MSDCIEWWGPSRNSDGYGVLKRRGQRLMAHRMVWEECFGLIPEGMVVRHKVCDNPPCVNPEHLMLGTVADNNRDMREKGRDRYKAPEQRTHCIAGHEFTEENTRWSPRTGRDYPIKVCRTCAKRRRQEHAARKRLDVRNIRG